MKRTFAIIVTALLGMSAFQVSAQVFTTLYGFTNAQDGINPVGQLALSGNILYGTTEYGGSFSNGTVFSVSTTGAGYTNVHSFTGGSDGGEPFAALILTNTTLYGTTVLGGAYGYGTVFGVTTNGIVITNLHDFNGASGSDSSDPYAGLILSGNTLYGTASGRGDMPGSGSGMSGYGKVYSVTTNSTGFRILRAFTNGNDGSVPYAGLILSGNTLYGTASQGGSNGYGTVFSININGSNFTVLHTFTTPVGDNQTNSDGTYPYAGLVLSGNTLYGTAEIGGTSGYGTVFSLNTNGSGFATLHSFTDGSDGANTYAGLILSGNTLYGTALQGGAFNYGTVFAINTNGSSFATLYAFTGGSDGAYPQDTLILSGNTLYGTADEGGSVGNGTVFSLFIGVSVPVLTWTNPASIVYGTALTSNQLNATASVPGNFIYSPNAGTILDAGTNIVSVTFFPSNAMYYTNVTTNVSLVVSPANLKVTANNQVKTYGQAFSFAGTEFTTVGLVNNDTVTSATLSSSGAATTATVSGSPYPISPSLAVGTGLSNYMIAYFNGQLMVNAAQLTITANNTNKAYGQTLTFAGTEFTPSGLLNSDTVNSVTLTSAGTAATATVAAPGPNYGITPSVAVGSGLGNYNITYNNGTLTVNKAPLAIAANSTSKTYGQTLTFAGTEFTPAGLFNSDMVTSVTLTSAGAAPTATVTSPGPTYNITPSVAVGSGLGNYNITYNNGTLTVNSAMLTITANNTNKAYGQTLTFAGTEFTQVGLTNNDMLTSVTLASAGTAATATVTAPGPNYSITPGVAVGSGLGNYNIAYNSGTLTVNKAPLAIAANSTSKTYGQTLTFAGTEFTPAGLFNSDMVTSVTLTSAGAAPTATVTAPGPNYSITPSVAVGSGLGNYNITYNNGTLTVNKAPLAIAANSTSKTYGQTLTFAGTEFTQVGLTNNDMLTSVTLASAGTAPTATVTAPGPNYSITPSVAVGSGLGNYNIAYNNGTLTVNSAMLTITANNTNKAYGQTLTFAGTEFTQVGLTNNDMLTSVTLASAGTAATATVTAPGPNYSITPSVAVGSGLGNYTIAYNNGTLTVNSAMLTITANNTSKTYGQTLTFAGSEFTQVGLTNNDTLTSVTLASAGTAPTATVTSPGPTYTIVPSLPIGSGLGNYNIAYNNGTLTVNSAMLTITANNTNKTYGQTLTFAGTEFTQSGLVNSDTITTVTLLSAGTAATASVAQSPYPITPTTAVGTGLSNYMIAYANGMLTIGQAVPQISWATPAPITYGAPLTSNQLDAMANVSGSPAYDPTNGSVLDAGTNSLTALFTPTDAVDYTSPGSMVSLIVLPAPLTVTASNVFRAFGQPNPALTGTITGVTNGDDITVTFGCDATNNSPVGTYSIVPNLMDPNNRLTNYTVGLFEGTLTIVPFASGIVFTLEPVGATNVPIGSNVVFTAVGESLSFPDATILYQWRLNGVNIPGATNMDLSFQDVQATNGGTITVTISDGVNAATSVPVDFSVAIPTVAAGNTNFENRFTLPLTPTGVLASSNTNGTPEPGGPQIISGNPGGKPIWFQWQPTNSGVTVFTTTGSDFDTTLGAYTGTSVDALTRVPSCVNDDDSGGNLTSTITFNYSAGTAYDIVVDGYWGVSGNVVLSWVTENLAEPLPTLLVVPPRQTVASNGAAVTLVCQPDSGVPSWFFDGQFTGVTAPDFLIATLDDTNVGAYVAETTLGVGGAVAITQPAHVQFNVLEDGTSDPNSIAWNKFLDAANSPYSNPTQSSIRKLGGGDTHGYSVAQTFSTLGAVAELGDPSIDGQIGGSPTWYAYVATTNGALRINTDGSSFNTLLGVYIGPGNSLATLTNIGAAYTTDRMRDGQPQIYIPNVPQGQTNFILVDGYKGASGMVLLNIFLGDPVVIGTPPQSQFAVVGSNVTFTAGADGSTPLTYFWQFDGTNIAGATNGTLTISNVQPANVGVYTIVISNFVSVTSNSVTLSLLTTLMVEAPPFNSSAFHIQLMGAPGGNYVLQASTDLLNWVPFITNIATGGFLQVTDTNASNFDFRFYRGIEVSP